MNKVGKISILLALSLAVFANCKGKKVENNDFSGNITVAGSSALQPLVQQGAKIFMEKNTAASINVQGGGSGTGLTQVSSGSIDIGNSDIFAEEKLGADKAKELVDHKVCVVGFGVVVNQKVSIDGLSKTQLIDIFTGKVTNWKEVGGKDLAIVVVNRPKSSGTRATFKKIALDGNDEIESKALTEDSSGAVKKIIESTEGSIGYLATSYLNDKANITGLKIIKFEGAELSSENIASGKYKIASYEHMYTKGEAKSLAKSFLDFMVSEEMKPVISKLGYIAISDMKVELK